MSRDGGHDYKVLIKTGSDENGDFEIYDYMNKESCDCDSDCNCGWLKTKLATKKEYKNGKITIIWEKK